MTIAGVDSWFEITGDRLVAFRRGSRQGGSLVFLINVEDRIAKTTVKPRWGITTGHDLLNDQALTLADVFDDAAGKPLAALFNCSADRVIDTSVRLLQKLLYG